MNDKFYKRAGIHKLFIRKKHRKVIQSCAEQSSHENPLEPDDYANPGRIFSLF